jgi:hypothetical protein
MLSMHVCPITHFSLGDNESSWRETATIIPSPMVPPGSAAYMHPGEQGTVNRVVSTRAVSVPVHCIAAIRGETTPSCQLWLALNYG